MTRFADSYFFIALLDRGDHSHTAAKVWLEANDDLLLTTRWVLSEVANMLRSPQFRRKVADALGHFENDSVLMIAEPSDALYRRSLALYAQHSDKDWSLTDCISFVVMNEQGLREALTGDHHFAQAGFVPLFAKR